VGTLVVVVLEAERCTTVHMVKKSQRVTIFKYFFTLNQTFARRNKNKQEQTVVDCL
jgi:hypothetical protein